MATASLDFTKPHLLRNAREYQAATAEIDRLLDEDPRSGTDAYERLEFLSVLVEAYETERGAITDSGTPQEVVELMLEQRGMTRGNLAPVMGGRARVSEFFAGKRPLSMGQVVKLRDLLHIPADLLIPAPREVGTQKRRRRNGRGKR